MRNCVLCLDPSLSNSKSIAYCSRGPAFIMKMGKLTFSKTRQKSIIPISPNCDEELCTVFGPILVKYQIQNPSQTVAEEVNFSRKWAKVSFSKIHQKTNNSNFTKLWWRIVHSVWTYTYKISNSKSITYCSRGPAFIRKMSKIAIFKNSLKNK